MPRSSERGTSQGKHRRHLSFAEACRDRHAGRHCNSHPGVNLKPSTAVGPELVPYLLYEKEASGILWIKFNQPEKMNALVGTAEESGTVAKVGEYVRAADDNPDVRVIVLTRIGRGLCSGADLNSRATAVEIGPEAIDARGSHEGPDATRQHFFYGLTKVAPRHLADPQTDDRHD
jgi:hypothetical protein